MCCFSREVQGVADTKIFARSGKEGRQFLVYAMNFKAAEDLAMILPIPTPKDAKEDAVKFLSLEDYPTFFDEMREGFPVQPSQEGKGDGKDQQAHDSRKPLEVVQVGSFEASFVPTAKDFARLDERFRLPAGTWDQLPQYAEWGFAVFKLKSGKDKQSVHPMAFDFPRAKAERLFFPTVHIHDGKIHAKAGFDHALYCQNSADETVTMWEESPQPAGLFMKKLPKAHGIVDPEGHVYRKMMVGEFKNEDVWV
jgi:hypothetical protein